MNNIEEENKILNALIMQWRLKLVKDLVWEGNSMPYKHSPQHLEEFDKHFNIITVRMGTTEKNQNTNNDN
jgi:hypothetical protein